MEATWPRTLGWSSRAESHLQVLKYSSVLGWTVSSPSAHVHIVFFFSVGNFSSIKKNKKENLASIYCVNLCFEFD